MVELYKQETAGEEQPTKLVFPTPTPESRMPRVWLVVASVLAAVALYYGWGPMQERDLATVERVPAVPDRLIAQTGVRAGTESGDATSTAGTSSVGVDPVSTAQAASSTAPVDTEPMPPADAATSAGSRGGAGVDVMRTAGLGNDRAEHAADIARDTPSEAPIDRPGGSAGDDTFVFTNRESMPSADRSADGAAAKQPAPAPRPPPPITATAADVPAPGADTEVETGAETSPEGQAPAAAAVKNTPWPTRLAVRTVPSTTESGDLPPPLPTGASPAAGRTDTGRATGGYVPQVYGIGNSEARVVVHATMDSWVQIRGGGNELLLTRILRAGDRYLAPDRADLLMMTGNAGGLEIHVDGKALPPIGPVGAVKRDVSLYVENLLAGKPVAR